MNTFKNLLEEIIILEAFKPESTRKHIDPDDFAEFIDSIAEVESGDSATEELLDDLWGNIESVVLTKESRNTFFYRVIYYDNRKKTAILKIVKNGNKYIVGQ